MTRLSLSLVALARAIALATRRRRSAAGRRDVEGQPLAANAERLAKALDFLGAPLAGRRREGAGEGHRGQGREEGAGGARQARAVRREHQPGVAGEGRPRAGRGAGLQQAGWTPVLVKVVNESTVKKPLRILSPQAGPVYSGPGRNEKDPKDDPKIVERFLQVEMFTAPPMTAGPERARRSSTPSRSSTRPRPASARRPSASTSARGTRTSASAARPPVLFDVKPAIAGEARRSPTSTASRPSAGSRSPTRPGTSTRRRPSGSPRTSSSSSRSTGPTAAPCCCRRASSRWSTAAGRSIALKPQKVKIDGRQGRRRARGQARALDQPGGLRLVQRRPPHPRRRLRPLHEPDRGRAARGHVPARQGRRAERRLLPDVGAVLRLPAEVLRGRARTSSASRSPSSSTTSRSAASARRRSATSAC